MLVLIIVIKYDLISGVSDVINKHVAQFLHGGTGESFQLITLLVRQMAQFQVS